MNILVSACLLGVPCRYDGGANRCPALLDALREGGHTPVPVCPEVYGGLPTPRPPAERQGERVTARTGADVTAAYRQGAAAAVQLARLAGCQAAVLKANSPSCGVGCIYDGSFTHTKIPGDGVAAAALREAGLTVYTEQDFAPLFAGGAQNHHVAKAETEGETQ